jgi:hypothetical protein
MADDSAPTPRPALGPPPGTPRRTFLARLAGGLAGLLASARRLAYPRTALAVAASATQTAQPNAGLLAALGGAVLPAELGADSTRQAVADFQRWMDAYRPGAEANHGYGTATIQRLPADPRRRWRAQLTALDQAARRKRGAPFTSLSRTEREAIVRDALGGREALGGERGESLPNPLAARHVAVALLAHFYDSPAATDLCYGARIGRQQCRPLSAARLEPVPLTRRAP